MLLVAVIIAIIWIFSALACGPDDSPTAADSSTAPTTSATPTPTADVEEEPKAVEINEDDYIGDNVDDVRDSMNDLGLDPKVSVQENDGSHEPDTVSGLDPTRNLYEGDTITIRYYGERPEVEPTPTEEEEPTEDPTEEPTDDESSDGWVFPELPDDETTNGNGNGNGNGGGGNG